MGSASDELHAIARFDVCQYGAPWHLIKQPENYIAKTLKQTRRVPQVGGYF